MPQLSDQVEEVERYKHAVQIPQDPSQFGEPIFGPGWGVHVISGGSPGLLISIDEPIAQSPTAPRFRALNGYTYVSRFNRLFVQRDRPDSGQSYAYKGAEPIRLLLIRDRSMVGFAHSSNAPSDLHHWNHGSIFGENGKRQLSSIAGSGTLVIWESRKHSLPEAKGLFNPHDAKDPKPPFGGDWSGDLSGVVANGGMSEELFHSGSVWANNGATLTVTIQQNLSSFGTPSWANMATGSGHSASPAAGNFVSLDVDMLLTGAALGKTGNIGNNRVPVPIGGSRIVASWTGASSDTLYWNCGAVSR